MFALAIVYAFIGVALGLRFKVLVLVPTIAITVIAITGVSFALGIGLWSPIIVMVVAVIAIQLGYLGGAVIRLFLANYSVRRLARPQRAVPLQPRGQAY